MGLTLSFVVGLWRDDGGQDLIEYTLLLAFVVLAVAGLFIQGGQSLSGIWSEAKSELTVASSAAGS